jgi:hypothetical protein
MKEYGGKPRVKKCSGDAHKPDVDMDHCMVCLPGWGEIYLCPYHNTRVAQNGWCEECRKYYER